MNVFISCPISVPECILNSTINSVKSLGHTPDYWQRGSHYNKTNSVKKCDVFIMILPRNQWNIDSNSLTFGCKGEFFTALQHKKKILLAYNSSINGLGIYDVEIKATYNSYNISGIGKTANKYLKNTNKAVEYISEVNRTFSESVNSMDLSILDGMIISGIYKEVEDEQMRKAAFVEQGTKLNILGDCSFSSIMIDFSKDRRLLLLLR